MAVMPLPSASLLSFGRRASYIGPLDCNSLVGCSRKFMHKGGRMLPNLATVRHNFFAGRVKLATVLSSSSSSSGTQTSACGESLSDGHEAERYIKRYAIKATGTGVFTESKTDTGHVLQTDVPKKMGGGDEAPQPVEHLLSALIGCTQATAVFVGRSMRRRVLIERMEFDLSAQRDERGALSQPIHELPLLPSKIQKISGKVKVFLKGGRRLSPEEVLLLSEQTEARCPVANMVIASGCEMDITWEDGLSS